MKQPEPRELAFSYHGSPEQLEFDFGSYQLTGIKLIALNGPKGVGKTTVAKAVAQELYNHDYSPVHMSFADPLRSMLHAFGVSYEDMRDPVKKEEKIKGLDKSPRELLQSLGTDWGRELVGDNVWLYAMETKLKNYMASYGHERTVFIIDDCRFDNEAEFVDKIGGMTFELRRRGIEYTGEHASEAPLSDDVIDKVPLLYCGNTEEAAQHIYTSYRWFSSKTQGENRLDVTPQPSS